MTTYIRAGLSIFCLMVSVTLSHAEIPRWSVGFYRQEGTPALPVANIQWDGLTHIVHNNAYVRDVGTLSTPEAGIAANLVATAHANNVKVLVGLSSNNEEADLNSAVQGHLSTLIASIMDLINTYGYDGVDIDWEPAGGFLIDTTSGTDIVTLGNALRVALGTKLLTVDVLEQDFTFWSSRHGSFDRLNAMSYDLFAGSNIPWFNSPLYGQDGLGGAPTSLDEIKTEYLGTGIPSNKLLLGIGFYGNRFNGGRLASDAAQGISGPRQVWQSGSAPTVTRLLYNEITPLITPELYKWDDLSAVPYLSNPGTPSTAWYVTYDDPRSVAAKVQYCISQNLGGWLIWPIRGGYFPGDPNPHPLLDAVSQAMSTATTPAPPP